MPKKFYAVKRGKNPGVYKSWPECKAQVDGYSNPIYKGFDTKEEAEAFVKSKYYKFKPKTIQELTADDAIAYVDGSYDIKTGKFSYGIVFLTRGRTGIESKCFSRAFDNYEMASMRNVAGEIMGASKAIDYALKRKKRSLVIYYDYEGIEKWANDLWQAKKTGTAEYKAKVAVARELGLKIYFVKVKAHSGDKFNEMADSLAKGVLENA